MKYLTCWILLSYTSAEEIRNFDDSTSEALVAIQQDVHDHHDHHDHQHDHDHSDHSHQEHHDHSDHSHHEHHDHSVHGHEDHSHDHSFQKIPFNKEEGENAVHNIFSWIAATGNNTDHIN